MPLSPPAALRPLFRIGGSLVAGAMLLAGTTQAVSALAHEEETLVDDLDADGLRVLDVDNSAGAVRVVGTDDDVVTVTTHVSNGLRSSGHGHHLEGDRLVVDGSCPLIGSLFCEVTYTIEVPARMDMRVRSEDRASVSDVDGDVAISTDNGRVEALRIGGDVRLETDNGRVTATDLASETAMVETDNGRVELGFASSPRTVVAQADNGSVDVVLPDEPGIDYAIDADTENGTVSDQVRQDPTSRRIVTAESQNGSVTVRYPS